MMNTDPSPFADELVICTLIDILKPAPAANVIDKNAIKICVPGLNVINQRLEAVSPTYSKTAKALIRISANCCQSPTATITSAWFCIEYFW